MVKAVASYGTEKDDGDREVVGLYKTERYT
jgi:hypothetical protein